MPIEILAYTYLDSFRVLTTVTTVKIAGKRVLYVIQYRCCAVNKTAQSATSMREIESKSGEYINHAEQIL